MTVIIGFKDKDGVIMAADGAMSSMAPGSFTGQIAESKLWKVSIGRKRPMIMASRGSVRFGQIARHCVEYPKIVQHQDEAAYLVGSVVPALMKAYEANKWPLDARFNENNDLIVGIENRLFEINAQYYSVSEFHDPWISIGDGASAAYGAIDMMLELSREQELAPLLQAVPPERIMIHALYAACRRNWSCGYQPTIVTNTASRTLDVEMFKTKSNRPAWFPLHPTEQ